MDQYWLRRRWQRRRRVLLVTMVLLVGLISIGIPLLISITIPFVMRYIPYYVP